MAGHNAVVMATDTRTDNVSESVKDRKHSMRVLSVREGSVKGKGRLCVCMAVVSPKIEQLIHSLS